MKLGIDLDGVTVDFSTGWRRAYHKWFGKLLVEDNKWGSIVEQTHFDEESDFWAWVDSNPSFWLDLPEIPGALGALYDLRRAGHQIVFVTNRKPKARLDSLMWLAKRLRCHPDDLFMVRDKADVAWDVLVEDNPRNIEECEAAGRTVIAFAAPYNKGVGKIVAHSWGEVRYIVDSMADVFTEEAA